MRLQHAKSAWAALIRAGSGQIGGVRWAVNQQKPIHPAHCRVQLVFVQTIPRTLASKSAFT